VLAQIFRLQRPVLLTLAAVLVLAPADAPAQVKGTAKNLPKIGPDHPVVVQLMNSFAAYDRNRDDHLDLRELANIFRYATPLDLPIPKAGEAESSEGSSAKAVDESKYASRNDYQFLKKVDQNSDRRVSKEEYQAYALDYAAEYVQLVQEAEEVQRQIIQAQQQQRQRDLERLRDRQRDIQRRQQLQRQRDLRNRR
jgi:hypothetical protein